jgi:hypothetical protein
MSKKPTPPPPRLPLPPSRSEDDSVAIRKLPRRQRRVRRPIPIDTPTVYGPLRPLRRPPVVLMSYLQREAVVTEAYVRVLELEVKASNERIRADAAAAAAAAAADPAVVAAAAVAAAAAAAATAAAVAAFAARPVDTVNCPLCYKPFIDLDNVGHNCARR